MNPSLNPNLKSWNPETSRKSAAAVAAVASILVIGSVIGLFASEAPAPEASVLAANPAATFGVR